MPIVPGTKSSPDNPDRCSKPLFALLAALKRLLFFDKKALVRVDVRGVITRS